MDTARVKAQQLLADGYNASLVANRLHRDHGLSVHDAARVVHELTGKEVPSRHASGVVLMMFGGAVFLVAAAFTLVPWWVDADSYIIWYGGLAFGPGVFFAGLKQYRKPIELHAPRAAPVGSSPVTEQRARY